MLPSDRFRRQHEELAMLAEEILGALETPAFPGNARDVRRMMARFKGKLSVHSTMENEALYPHLLAHDNPEIRARSQAIFDELGGIYDTVTGHHTRWTSVEAIEADPMGYVRHTREMFDRLKMRIIRENTELYPLADMVEPRGQSQAPSENRR